MASLKRKAVPLTASPQDQKKPKKDATLTSFFGAPKITPSANSTSNGSTAESTTVKFDKEKWVASLNDEQKELLKLEIDTLDPSWLSHLKDEVTSREFLDLKRFLQKEIDSGKKIFPPLEDVYSWYGILINLQTSFSRNLGLVTLHSLLSVLSY
jgi:uracil-DNA glycosylase